MRRFTIGVDLGGTNLRAAAFNEQGIMLDQTSAKTHLAEGPGAVVDDIVTAITAMRHNHRDHELIGVGVGVPGFIRLQEGVIVGSNNLATLDGYPIRDAISKKLGLPVMLENDANAAALGEWWLGAGKDVDDLVLITLGTGVGGGIISRGHVIHGSLGMAGEIGHITVHPEGNPCGCGNRGCLEKHASATAISAMAELIQLGRDLEASDVHQFALAGDRRARQVFESVGHSLGIAIATLINIFNFPLYLISGGPLPSWDFFAPAMMQEIETRSYTFRHSKTRVEKALLGNLAGLYGAAYLPYQQ